MLIESKKEESLKKIALIWKQLFDISSNCLPSKVLDSTPEDIAKVCQKCWDLDQQAKDIWVEVYTQGIPGIEIMNLLQTELSSG